MGHMNFVALLEFVEGDRTMITRNKLMSLGSVSIGDKFIYRTADIFGTDAKRCGRVPFEGQMLTVVGFQPRYVNQVELSEANGRRLLLPLREVEKALGRDSEMEAIAENQQHTTHSAHDRHAGQGLNDSELADAISVLHKANPSVLRRLQGEICRVLQQRDQSIPPEMK